MNDCLQCGQIKQQMLDKYEHFKKVSKTESCSFYEAEDRTTMQNVLLKRLKQKSTWDQLLTNPNLQYLSKASFAPKMVQIFKKKGYYFIAFDKPLGPPLSEPQEVGKLPLNKFYPLFHNLVESCVSIQQHSPEMYVLPEWIFIHRNFCKIGHFEPFFASEVQQNNKHVFMYNLERSMIKGKIRPSQSDPIAYQKQHSLTFNLGIIGYQLLTGQKAVTAENEEQYLLKIKELGQSAQKKLKRYSKDEKLSTMLTKMIKQDPFDSPNLTQIYNTVKRKAKDYLPKGSHNPTVQLQLQKIHLKSQLLTANQNKKMIRPCCKTVENEEQEIQRQRKGNITVAYPRKDYQSKRRSKSFLPDLNTNRHRYRSKDTFLSKSTRLKSEGVVKLKQV